jgi:hypothetical protein
MLVLIRAQWKGNLPKEAPNDMLQQTDSLLLDELVDHVAKDGADGVKAFVGLADVRQADIIQQDLLHDKDRDGLAEFGAGLHDTKTEWDDFGCQEEIDDLGGVILDKCTNDTK